MDRRADWNSAVLSRPDMAFSLSSSFEPFQRALYSFTAAGEGNSFSVSTSSDLELPRRLRATLVIARAYSEQDWDEGKGTGTDNSTRQDKALSFEVQGSPTFQSRDNQSTRTSTPHRLTSMSAQQNPSRFPLFKFPV